MGAPKKLAPNDYDRRLSGAAIYHLPMLGFLFLCELVRNRFQSNKYHLNQLWRIRCRKPVHEKS